MTLADIARLAGVSRTTASYVINGQAEQRRISNATIEKVMAVVRQHRYHIDPQAAALRRGASRLIGLIVPDLENISYARLAKRLERGAREQGYQLLVASSDDCADSERALALALRAQRCEVLITASCLAEEDTFYSELVDEGWCVVGMDRGLAPTRFASVVSNDQDAAYALTRSVITGSTRRVAWLEAMPSLSISRERRVGFQSALQDTSIEPVLLSGTHYERSEGARLAAQLLDEKGGADALITASYVLMEGVFDVFLERGGLPENMRLATFGDHRLLDFLPQAVNSALQDYDRIAELTLRCALNAMNGDYQCGQQVVARHLRTR
ncbi:catabolite repressor/activator [Vreelandella alkaliphila]|uniref:Catabolite repressor/activator n=1 Tax=Halomonas campaniensis TaxID=213554 RepID=A0A3D0KDU0_9GAMM|nr:MULTISPECIES: catabolite repressor/activator [unclassified Halomonas]HBS82070.1 catabolite repressor/activator [Halomonas campaniensis]HCA01329.1 catabolite repressor/activator [Halomonas campaniensis]